jgi:acetylornithine deacetylase/succinyl-diaminopimelate desuccinylase-like protein
MRTIAPKQVLRFMVLTFLAGGGALVARQAGAPGALSPEAQRAAIRELVSLVSLPNVATNQADIRRNADYLREAFARRGFSMEVVETRHSPVVIGVRQGSARPGAAARDLTFYCHYDGQPVVPAEWRDSGPFQPILRDAPLERGGKVVTLPASGPVNPDWRLYARSSSDDKGPIAALLTALDLWADSPAGARSPQAVRPGPTIRVVFEGDEEAGSPVLEEALRAHAALVKSDLVIMMDGPQHLSGRPTFFFGARGIISAELTVFGARHDLHSGNYGNWAPNPALDLARLLASMKDDQGRVTIDGFYDEVVPLTPEEKQAIAEIPSVEEEQMRALGFARPEVPGTRIEARHNLPTLNVSGLGAGTVAGQGRTVIPATATSRLDLRVVNAIDPARQFARLKGHIERQGFHLVSGEAPTDEERARWPRLARLVQSEGYPAGRTPMDEPTARAVIAAVAGVSGKPAVRYPTLGGSAPFYIFSARLGVPTIGMPVANYDNNQHGPNENLRLGAYFEAIDAIRAILSMQGGGRR